MRARDVEDTCAHGIRTGSPLGKVNKGTRCTQCTQEPWVREQAQAQASPPPITRPPNHPHPQPTTHHPHTPTHTHTQIRTNAQNKLYDRALIPTWQHPISRSTWRLGQHRATSGKFSEPSRLQPDRSSSCTCTRKQPPATTTGNVETQTHCHALGIATQALQHQARTWRLGFRTQNPLPRNDAWVLESEGDSRWPNGDEAPPAAVAPASAPRTTPGVLEGIRQPTKCLFDVDRMQLYTAGSRSI